MVKNVNRSDPQALAVAVLTYLAADPERLGRFFSLTGLDPASLREAAATPAFVRSILSYLAADETLLIGFAKEARLAPIEVGQAVRHATDPDIVDL